MNPTPMTLRDVAALLRLTLSDPAEGARAILSLGVPREHHWTLFLLAISLSGALWQLSLILQPPELAEGAVAPSGLVVAAIEGGSILLVAAAIRWIGRLAGGEGEMEDVLLLTIWFQLVQNAIFAVSLVLSLLVPVLGAVLTVAVLAWLVWVMTNFIAVVHGFRSLGRVFLGMMLAALALVFVLSIVIAPFMGAPTGT